MIKTLTRHGNSWALVIDKPIMELLKIEPTTPLRVSTDGRTLTIGPADLEYEEKVRAASQRINERHAKAFKKLAE